MEDENEKNKRPRTKRFYYLVERRTETSIIQSLNYSEFLNLSSLNGFVLVEAWCRLLFSPLSLSSVRLGR